MSHKPGRNVTQAGPKCHTRAKMSHSHVIIFINNNDYFLEAHIYSMNVILTSYNNNLITSKSGQTGLTKCIKWLTSAHHLPVEWWETGRGCVTQVQAICCQVKSPSLRWAGEVTCCPSALRVECKFWLHRRKCSCIYIFKKNGQPHLQLQNSQHTLGLMVGQHTPNKKSPEQIYVCVHTYLRREWSTSLLRDTYMSCIDFV